MAKKESDAYGAAGSIAEEILTSIRTVISFGGESKETARYEKQLLFARDNNIKRSMFSGIGFGLLWFFIYSTYALAFWYGVKLVLDERSLPNPTYDAGNMVTVCFSFFVLKPELIKVIGHMRASKCNELVSYSYVRD